MKKAWGIFCSEHEVETIKKRLEKRRLDIFEVRPLTLIEKITYVNHPNLYNCVEPYIVMFHATALEYKMFIFMNKLTKVF